MPRRVRRLHASTAVDGESPDKRALKATWVPKGEVAGSSMLVVRSRSGAADRAASAAASAAERVAKAPTWINQRPGGDTEEKATGRAILSWIGRPSIAYRGAAATGAARARGRAGAAAGGSIDCPIDGGPRGWLAWSCRVVCSVGSQPSNVYGVDATVDGAGVTRGWVWRCMARPLRFGSWPDEAACKAVPDHKRHPDRSRPRLDDMPRASPWAPPA